MKKYREIEGMFEGKIWPITLKLAAPMIIAQLVQYIYAIVDTIFIAGIDRTATHYISGTGLVFPVFFLFIALGEGIFIGVNSLVAQGIGEQNSDKIENTAESAFVLAFIISLLAILGGIYADKVIGFLAGDKLSAQAIEAGVLYLRFLVPGLCFISFGRVLAGILQGEGINKYTAMAMVGGTVLNIILDPIFIYTLDMKTAGAALATSISFLFGLGFLLVIFVRNISSIPVHGNLFHARMTLIREVLNIGMPHSLGMIALSVVFVVLNNLVSSISEVAMNAWSLVGRMDQLIFIIPISVGGATITMIGQNLGRKQYSRLKTIYLGNSLYAVTALTVIVSLYVLLSGYLFQIFTDVPEVLSKTLLQVRIVAPTLIAIAISIISGSTLQAVGRPLIALVLILIRAGLFALPLVFSFVYLFNMGLWGVFLGMALGNILSFLISFTVTIQILNKIALKKSK